MPCVQTSIVSGQAILGNVFILPPGELRKRVSEKQGPIQIKDHEVKACSALIDTGAQISCIARQVVRSLGLVSKSKLTISGATGTAETFVYDADLVLPDIGWGQESISLAGLDISPNAKYQILLGMDILGLGTLHFNYGFSGKPGICTFCI